MIHSVPLCQVFERNAEFAGRRIRFRDYPA
jgi:hypothetical protein